MQVFPLTLLTFPQYIQEVLDQGLPKPAVTEITKVLSKRYEELSAEEKERYIKRYQEEKARYEQEKKEYEESGIHLHFYLD